MNKFVLFILLIPAMAFAQGNKQLALNEGWTFALDPVKIGEADKWYTAGFASGSFDKVNVPHSFSVDKRYFNYTGTAWYFKKFQAAVVPTGYRAFLRFDAVFYKTKVWFNGQLVGTHEGGYTQFEWDITPWLQSKNTLSLLVNNEWDTTTIPGAKTAGTTLRPNATQLYAWMNYGGITRPVYLVIRPDLYVQKAQVIAEPDLQKAMRVSGSKQ
ncbi:sugar-binding domain-containing protein [Paraflavitalea speifideaquila]|uniref:sugar-binding domain-containing protein n=1 Tax=Paraflavitalea speifideaquila TaxID=3076558 RepID=UPI0028E2C0CB|nr:sugar-binding domain-containing protein [Paraflavitalea speifideiaquila]